MKRRERENLAGEEPSGAERVLEHLLERGVELGWDGSLGEGEDYEIQLIVGRILPDEAEQQKAAARATSGVAAAEGCAAVVTVVPAGTGLIPRPQDLRTDDDLHGAVLRVLPSEAGEG